MQVFSAFGFVHKITTFEKTAGFQVCLLFTSKSFYLVSMGLEDDLILEFYFQALVQFSDAQIATDAKNSLDGRNIPR